MLKVTCPVTASLAMVTTVSVVAIAVTAMGAILIATAFSVQAVVSATIAAPEMVSLLVTVPLALVVAVPRHVEVNIELLTLTVRSPVDIGRWVEVAHPVQGSVCGLLKAPCPVF